MISCHAPGDSTTGLWKHVDSHMKDARKGNALGLSKGSPAYTNAPKPFRRLLVDWLSENYRPFSIVEDPALKTLFQKYAKIVMPSRNTLKADMEDVATEVLNDTKKILRGLARQGGTFYCVFDGWTSFKQEHIFAVVLISVLPDMTLRLDLLNLKKLPDGTAVTLSRYLEETLAAFGLMVTDIETFHADTENTVYATIRTALLAAGVSQERLDGGFNPYIPCVDHGLNSALKDVMFRDSKAAQDSYRETEVHRTLQRVRTTISTLRASNIHTQDFGANEKKRIQILEAKTRVALLQVQPASAEAAQLQEDLKDAIQHQTIPSDVQTRFSSTNIQVNAFVEALSSVPEGCVAEGLDLSDPLTEKRLQQVNSLLTNFQALMQVIEGEKYCTMSLVLPGLVTLLATLTAPGLQITYLRRKFQIFGEMLHEDAVLPEVQQLKKDLFAALAFRLDKMKLDNPSKQMRALFACFFHPVYKGFEFLGRNGQTLLGEVQNNLKAEARRYGRLNLCELWNRRGHLVSFTIMHSQTILHRLLTTTNCWLLFDVSFGFVPSHCIPALHWPAHAGDEKS